MDPPLSVFLNVTLMVQAEKEGRVYLASSVHGTYFAIRVAKICQGESVYKNTAAVAGTVGTFIVDWWIARLGRYDIGIVPITRGSELLGRMAYVCIVRITNARQSLNCLSRKPIRV